MAGKARTDYEVGHGKPPMHSRFQPGRSGNPKGRPKGRKNLAAIMTEILQRPVLIKQNGKERRVSFAEAYIHRLMARGLDGTARDMIAIMKAISDYAPDALVVNEPVHITVQFVDPKGNVLPLEDSRPNRD